MTKHRCAPRSSRQFKQLFICLFMTSALAACAQPTANTTSNYQPEILAVPAQLENFAPLAVPLNNPLTPEKSRLGGNCFSISG
jgi:hypothetical protein